MKTHKTKLIDGTFTTADARAVLLELLSYKINFHSREKVSDEERFGADVGHSSRRIRELNQEKEELTRWVHSLPADDKLKVNCIITLEVLE